MFSKFEHDPPGNDDIVLFAGPEERQALVTVLNQKTKISSAVAFIYELAEAVIDQTSNIEDINEDLGREYFHEDDDAVPFDRHLSDMCEEDVAKVLRHLYALFIDRMEVYTGANVLDNCLSSAERKNIFHTIITPWLTWVRSARQNKSDTIKDKSIAVTNNKKPSNKKTNTTNMNNDTTNNTTPANMFGSISSVFSNMLGKLEPDTVRMTFNGGIAVKTANGYKTYDVAKKKAVNMESLVMPDMSAFLLLPSTKVKTGDIILRDGTFYSIISVNETTNELEGYNYSAGKKETLVRETHCFLGNTYFYSKLVSPILSFFGGKPEDKKEEGSEASEDTMSMLLPLAMMSQNGDMNSVLPLLLMSKMEGNGESSGMLKMLMLSSMMGGGNSDMKSMLPLMLMSGNFQSI